MLLLAADIGATKTNLALVSSDASPREPLCEQTLPSGDYADLADLVLDFMAHSRTRLGSRVAPDRACFGVPGPVIAGSVEITNLPWVLAEDGLARDLRVERVTLLNDLAATAYAIPFLTPDELYQIKPGEPEPCGTIAVLAPGTGLGEAFLTCAGGCYQPHGSEGGHTDFSPTDIEQIGLLEYLLERFDHASYERVCSGIGLPHIYGYLRQTGEYEEPPELATALQKAEDPTPTITECAMRQPDPAPICVAALEMFTDLLAAEAANLALKVFATGGVYLGGGIPPRILPYLESTVFSESFVDKGRMSELLGRIPVHVILNPKAALLGAACYGLNAEHP
ncbi:MAG TPA: glucokinase [Armatimonadetes bacterium]|jgi:glucokinase|nr:glucokinase [Armatimonadota bacterium]